MRKRLGIATVVLGLVLLGPATSASALTEIGNNCAANEEISVAATVTQALESPGNPLSLTVATSGVITNWRVNTKSVVQGISEKLKVLRGSTTNPQVVGESGSEPIVGTQNIFKTRIPVDSGDRLGVFGPAGFLACTGGGTDTIVSYTGDVPVGANASWKGPIAGPKLAVSAFIEPDADGDGYGDETQDLCLQNPNLHTACPQPFPAISLDAFPIVLKRSVLVLVSASSTSAVHVFGQVGWKARPAAGARSSKVKPGGGPATTGLIVSLTGGTQTVNPGEVANFNVKLPKSVKRRLGQIPPSKSLKAQLTASTTDLAGRVSTSVLTIKLPGQDRR
ncbi:MAG TPA: hypothetical protein VN758_04250 [Solirubrobacterales bacterium]|nr:hypothetical protein [Solirubrobacterales bacterium]